MTLFYFIFSPPLTIQRISEREQIVQEYESSKAIPNPAVLGKLERALGAEARMFGVY